MKIDFENEVSLQKANKVIIGFPYDGTVSFRPGTRFGANAIRQIWDGIEYYSPYLDLDLADEKVYDIGDAEFPFGNRELILNTIESEIKKLLIEDKKIISLGGEHLITYPIIKAFANKYPGLTILHLDAHADLRDHYLGEKLSHATVMRRCSEIVGLENIISCGIRSGTKEEFNLKKPLLKKDFIEKIKTIRNPIYVSLDLDVLDPSIFPGTGTPEPGGFTFNELMEILYSLKGKNIVGTDLVELSPPYDSQGNSAIVAAKILREMLLII